MNTEELLQKCINYNQNAWAIFIKRYRSVITNSVKYKLNRLGILFSKNECKDIVQEILFGIWEKNKLRDLQNVSCLKNWLIIISLNATSNYCKKKIFRKTRSALSLDGSLYHKNSKKSFNKILISNEFNPERLLESSELHTFIKYEISKLEYRQQLALKFNIYHGKSQKDIAKIMNIPEGTVATLIKRAKNNLRKKLKEIL